MRSYKRLITVVLILLASFGISHYSWAEPVNIALISDGEGAREIIPLTQLTLEIRDLLEPQYQVSFSNFNGGWTEEGVNQVLQRALQDPEIDVIVAQGLVGTHIAGKLSNLSKPVIGMFVPEPNLQGLPLRSDKSSGKRNYTYISDLQSFDTSMKEILAILPKRKIGLITDQIIVDGVPMLANQEFFGDAEVELITSQGSLETLVSSLPNDLGSVMLAPLLRMTKQDIGKLCELFIQRGLPSVSFTGDITVEDGVLMAVGTDTVEVKKSARRVALNILSVLEGENAANLSVFMQFGRSLKYNQRTADAINFELPWDVSLIAEYYNGYPDGQALPQSGMSLNDAVNQALDANLRLAQQRLETKISVDDINIARSSWWPQLNYSLQGSQLDDEITAVGNPEKSIGSNISLNQLLYSEQAKAGLDIAKLNQQVARYQLDAAVLNTIQGTSIAYISVLRAKALEKVQRANLAASLENLELSESRFSLGAVTEADVLRWKSQIATDKRNLLLAQSNVNNAIVELQKIMRVPFEKRLNLNGNDTQRLISLSLNKEVRAIFDSPSDREMMTKFILSTAIEKAPETKEIKLLNAISQRNTKSAKRAFYVPTLSLVAQQNYSHDRSGLFANETDMALPDNSWSVNVVASFPLFQGRKRQAELSKAKSQEQQVKLNGLVVEDNIRTNTLTHWNAIGASYPAIFLSREAAEAAKRTLDMTRDQYSSGAINITTLIQAQNIALAAEIDAAEAQYAYLIDFVNVGRAVSDFRSIMDEKQGNAWLRDYKQYRQQHSVQ